MEAAWPSGSEGRLECAGMTEEFAQTATCRRASVRPWTLFDLACIRPGGILIDVLWPAPRLLGFFGFFFLTASSWNLTRVWLPELTNALGISKKRRNITSRNELKIREKIPRAPLSRADRPPLRETAAPDACRCPRLTFSSIFLDIRRSRRTRSRATDEETNRGRPRRPRGRAETGQVGRPRGPLPPHHDINAL